VHITGTCGNDSWADRQASLACLLCQLALAVLEEFDLPKTL
jgi:hypothetical protein